MSDPAHRRRRHWLGATMALVLLPLDRARAQAAGFVPQALPVERIAAERLAEDGTAPPLHKPIHSSGELLPVIGLPAGICGEPDNRAAVLTAESIGHFLQAGGRVIHLETDCENVLTALGAMLARGTAHERLFTAIRIDGADAAAVRARLETVRQHLHITRIDLVCVHDGDAPVEALAALDALKKEGRIRHVGLASTHLPAAGFEQILKRGTADFIETDFSLDRRDADEWLLPFALEHEIAVLATSPFGDGSLLQAAQRQPLPKWSADFGCTSWNQFFLKYAVSHPAVTCVIPDRVQTASLFSSGPLIIDGASSVEPGVPGNPRGDVAAGGRAAAGSRAAPIDLIADYAAAARNPMPDSVERKRMERFADALRR